MPLNVNTTGYWTNGVQQERVTPVVIFDHNGKPIFGGGSGATGQVSVNGSEVVWRSANTARRSVMAYVDGVGTLFYGPAGVTTANGMKCASGGSFTLDKSASAAWSVTSSGACTLYWLEELAP